MRALRFVAAEAWYEFRAAFRGTFIPIAFPALVGYVLLVVLNADYMRDMGGTDVPRNSPHLIYLMTSGQAVWLLFAWAWLFAQVVLRDRSARLHEVVLSAPVSLPVLLAGRYLGALAAAWLLIAAVGVGFLLVPVLGVVGLLPPEAVGPPPVFAIGHALVILGLPSAAGVGALFLCAAIRTRGLAGPFALAAVLMLVWMVSMVVLRGGDANVTFASYIDPSGFAEVEEQAIHTWTPREKAVGVLELTPPLIANRLIWSVPALILLAVVLRRVGRERLTLESAPAAGKRDRARGDAAAGPATAAAPLGPPGAPSWLRAAGNETAWHLGVALRGRGIPLALLLLAVAGVVGTFVNLIMHADGPFVARPDLTGPFVMEFFYLIITFIVAAFVGTMARRDDRAGYGEIVDSTPAPLGSRVAGLTVAVAAVTALFALMPVLSVWILSLLGAPEAFTLLDPLLLFGLGAAPSLLELAALVLLAHALIRHTGAAHAVGVICAFVVIINEQLGVTTYPPALIGFPSQVTLAEFTGWAPWLGHVLTADLFKLALAAVVAALAWIAWPRGTALTVPLRWRTGAGRLVGGAGAMAVAAVLLAVGTHRVLHERLVTGGYETAEAEVADDAAWESRWWSEAAPFAVAGGEATIEIDPGERHATVRWRIDGVRSSAGALHGSLPEGAEIRSAVVNGRESEAVVAFDHFALPLDACAPVAAARESANSAADPREPSAVGFDTRGSADEGCAVELELVVRSEGWSPDWEIPWLHPSGIWLRASDVLPSLGHDPDRLLRAPQERRLHGLGPVPGIVAAGAVAPAAGVAPAGDWRWTVTFAGEGDRANRPAGTRTAASGRTGGPLDFAVAWWPGAPVETRRDGLVALRGPDRTRDAGGVLDDVAAMRACVAATLGRAPAVGTVLQAPRERGETALHGDLLWLPEHEGWDIVGAGYGRWLRRATIAAALASRQLADDADLRKEPGEDWLRVGVPGWVGLECVRREDGADAWRALQARASDRVVEAFAALETPAVGVAAAGDVPWVRHYTPLATVGWVETVGTADAAGAVREVASRVRDGATLADALAGAVGTDAAAALLGPPAASDLLVEEAERTLDIAGQRWTWRDGGWEPTAASIHATQRFDDDGGSRRIGPVPTTVAPGEPFTLIDAWPSFERSPSDNVWRGEGDD